MKFKFYCETCGNEVPPEEGTLSWVEAKKALRDFRITHKEDHNHSCDPQNIAYVHLWMVTGPAGFTKLNERLTDYWGRGYTLKDVKGLKRVLNHIGTYLWDNYVKK